MPRKLIGGLIQCSNPVNDESLPLGTRAGLLALDPRNVTLEPEYYADCDQARFQRVKPLLWLWYSFDRTLVGGQNVWLGVELRRLLAKHIFKRCGENFKAFQHVEFSFGYNMDVGDDVVIHRHVLLDDRGGIVLGNRVSISDYANVYSHHHDIYDIHKVETPRTRIGNGVRLTYHSTVLAGMEIGDHALIGTGAVVTRNVEPYHIVVGIPARTAKIKDPNGVPKHP